jgi:hypothetical protein
MAVVEMMAWVLVYIPFITEAAMKGSAWFTDLRLDLRFNGEIYPNGKMSLIPSIVDRGNYD